MIITPKEVDEFSKFIDDYEENTGLSRAIAISARELGVSANPEDFAKNVLSHLSEKQIRSTPNFKLLDDQSVLVYLRNNPHLMIPAGFDEIRIETEPARSLAQAFYREAKKRGVVADVPDEARMPSHEAFEFMLGLRCRDAGTGKWYRTAHVDLPTYSLALRSDEGVRLISFRDIVSDCRRALTKFDNPAVLLLPNLWHPPAEVSHIRIAEATRELVRSLKNQAISLADLSWQQLEDVVAEVLRQKGFDIQVTPRSHDGGRDIVARGEMVPGEFGVLAVEIKHRSVVKLPEIRSHLYANKDFPMLLVATSGRFSAGVIREKQKPENFLRLHLRDGKAISTWIKEFD